MAFVTDSNRPGEFLNSPFHFECTQVPGSTIPFCHPPQIGGNEGKWRRGGLLFPNDRHIYTSVRSGLGWTRCDTHGRPLQRIGRRPPFSMGCKATGRPHAPVGETPVLRKRTPTMAHTQRKCDFTVAVSRQRDGCSTRTHSEIHHETRHRHSHRNLGSTSPMPMHHRYRTHLH